MDEQNSAGAGLHLRKCAKCAKIISLYMIPDSTQAVNESTPTNTCVVHQNVIIPLGRVSTWKEVIKKTVATRCRRRISVRKAAALMWYAF